MSQTRQFDYQQAFSRNIGWFTQAEQDTLRGKRVALAGLGGVGGIHLITLARLGVGAFNISDFDDFDIPNFNRQAGAMMSTVDLPKAEVLKRMALDINPELDIKVFPEGVNADNVDSFLDGVDLYVDSLDFFAFGARKIVFPACAAKSIPATIAAPLGMGSSLLNFLPGKMSFEDYFRWEGCADDEMSIRFMVGLSPSLIHRKYLADPGAVDIATRRVPSTAMGCQISAGVAASEAVKILLGRGRVICAPHGVHFDAYRNKLVHTWRPFGNGNPIQRLAIAFAKFVLRKGASAAG
jgi:molybdopterin/thiamine biosynthesis adenylyltransferase